MLQDPNAPPGFDKEPSKKAVEDALKDVADARKSEHPHPERIPLGGSWEGEFVPFAKASAERQLKRLLKLKVATRKLRKAYAAGVMGGAPSTLTGGAALQREDISERAKRLNVAKAALRDYGKPVRDKDDFRKFVKHKLPDASDEFVDHFVDRCHDFTMRKAEDERRAMKLEGVVLDLKKALDDVREQAKPLVVVFGGHQVLPGRARHAQGEHDLLREDEDGYVGVPAGKAGQHDADDLVRLPRLQEGSHFVVVARPRVLVNGAPHVYGGQ